LAVAIAFFVPSPDLLLDVILLRLHSESALSSGSSCDHNSAVVLSQHRPHQMSRMVLDATPYFLAIAQLAACTVALPRRPFAAKISFTWFSVSKHRLAKDLWVLERLGMVYKLADDRVRAASALTKRTAMSRTASDPPAAERPKRRMSGHQNAQAGMWGENYQVRTYVF